MVQINNELTNQFLADKIQEIKQKGDRKNIIETIDGYIDTEAETIKQALIERCKQLKRQMLEEWQAETQQNNSKILEQQRALKDYEDDIKQIEGLKNFKRIKLK